MLRIQLFNEVRLQWDGGPVVRLPAHKSTSLLAYLACHPQHSQRREVLLELFWPETGLEQARSNLSTTLWRLRRQLSESGADVDRLLHADRDTAALRPDLFTTDVKEFERLTARARSVTVREERVTLLREAVELYAGELLEGDYSEWARLEQLRLAAAHQHALMELLQLLETSGETAELVKYADRALVADAHNEAACAYLMRAYAERGQLDLALELYRHFERRFREELAAKPGAALQALAAQLATRRRGALPLSQLRASAPELPGGAVPLDSGYYVTRDADAEVIDAVERGESTVLLKGPRQTGKTSLLARALQHARLRGARVAVTDLAAYPARALLELDLVLKGLAESLRQQLRLPLFVSELWDDSQIATLNLRSYLRREALSPPEPLVWALDEVDLLLTRPYADELFALFRSWHNERALDPDGPWRKLTIVLTYSTEAHLFISDLNQSPFNVGTRVDLADFSPVELADLHRRYGSPLGGAEELGRLNHLLGGHPYLTCRALDALAKGRTSLGEMEASTGGGRALFEDHLRRMRQMLERDQELAACLASFADGGTLPSEAFFRLRSAGILTGESAGAARFRCGLYGFAFG